MPPRISVALLALVLCGSPAEAQPAYASPVLPGDHPDPSVIRVGDDYWATATTSQWAPIFPLLHSRDLVNWEHVGAVFEAPPEWSSGSYWAPEIAQIDDRFFVYYTARKTDGPLCVAVATAARPEGPYTDQGPLVCQEVGSIDGVPIADEQGRWYLVWKEDGNSRKQPTPLWAQRLSEDGTALEGPRHELMRNEAPWEAHLIEGAFVLRRGDWFYMFYSADACCGRACNYKLGVARARALLGPWERYPGNPLLAGNSSWKCPGHGSIVTTPDGRDYLLYHAYAADDFQFAGRQGVLDEITWDANGWPAINAGRGPSSRATAPLGVASRDPERTFLDELGGPALRPGWQWPWDQAPEHRFDAGSLILRAPADSGGNAAAAVVARPTRAGDYTATARLIAQGASGDGMAGLAAYGDADNAIGISLIGRRLVVWMREKGVQRSLASTRPDPGPSVDLRLVATEGRRFQFAYSTDGETWQTLGGEADGGYLPPWDRAVRVALAVGGTPDAEGRFDWLRIETRDAPKPLGTFERESQMKFMLMMNAPRGGGDWAVVNWAAKDFKAHVDFMKRFAGELDDAGELVGAEGLVSPGEARLVRAGTNGAPEVTDGPFAEAKEFLAGYWIVDVATPQRAYEIAARASAAPGPGGAPLNMPIEVRQVMSAPEV